MDICEIIKENKILILDEEEDFHMIQNNNQLTLIVSIDVVKDIKIRVYNID